jgi:hypothetical protein
MNIEFAALIPAVFAVVEGLEWLGVKKFLAHLLALPLGVLVCFLVMPQQSIAVKIILGLLVGVGAAGTCDTVGNCRTLIRSKRKPKSSDKKM